MLSKVRHIFASLFSASTLTGCLGAVLLSFILCHGAAAQDCTFKITPSNANVPAAGGTGSFQLSTPIECLWAVSSTVPWVTITSPSSGYGDGLVRFSVQTNTGAARSGSINTNAGPFTVNQAAATAAPYRPRFDFDGDGKADISIFRPGPAEWWLLRSSNGSNSAAQFGQTNDRIVPADYTGDGKTDIAFWRPATGEWFVLRSEDGSFYAFPFGTSGDVPVPADYDGDNKADPTVFRPSNNTWYVNRSTGGTDIIQFGAAGDKPVPSDYDGDGKADIAIYRPSGASGAEWWISRSTVGLLALQFGVSSDKAVQGDYTGDGKTDVAFFRPASGQWFILRSEDLSFYAFPFGASGDLPAPGDYDGDGKIDPAVFRPTDYNWFINRSTAGVLIMNFGTTGDMPVPSAFVP